MPRVKRETVTRYRFHPPDIIETITYIRRKRPPTLKQFALRQNFGNIAKENKGLSGTTAETGRLMPKVSKEMKQITGITAEKLITPEIIEKYNKKFKKVKKYKKE